MFHSKIDVVVEKHVNMYEYVHIMIYTSVSICCVFDSAGAASEADDEDPDDDGEDLSELDADVDISLCQDPELLM